MGKCHFLKEWLDRTDPSGCIVSEWGRKKTDSELFCFVCERSFSLDKGFHAITQHSFTEKHKTNMKIKRSSSQLLLTIPGTSSNTEISLCSSKDSAYRAELIWCLKTVLANISANSCQNIGDVFRAMFPLPGAVPETFSLNSTKVGYLIIEALSPYFRNTFLTEAQAEYYSLQYDETTNNAGTKELQISIRFWSTSRNEIAIKHLETFFLGHATAEDVKEKIISALDNASLPLSKLVMLGSDGPNVNKKVFRLMNEEVLLCRGKGLVDVGFCNIHVVHNAFKKGLEELGCDASDFIICLHAFFHDWPSRWEDFTEVQKRVKVPTLHFIKHVASRWLTLQPAAERVLQQWDAIVEYFKKHIPKKANHLMKTVGYKKINALLSKKTIKAELYFVISSASLFTEFTEYFQKEEPLIHLLYEHLKYLLKKILARICRTEALEMAQDPAKEILEAQNLLSPSHIILSNEVHSTLSEVELTDLNTFFMCAQKHYIVASKYILEKITLWSNIESFRCLQPSNITSSKSECEKNIIKVASLLPLKIDIDKLMAEWKLLTFEVKLNDENVRVDHFWSNIFTLKQINGLKYPTIAQVVKASLTIAHSSANVEKGFSRSLRVLTEDKGSMSAKMLNARLNILDGLQWYNNKPECVPITKELLNLAHNAYNSYSAYIEKERIRKEEEMKKKEDAAKKEAMEKETLEKLEDSKKDIERLKNELKIAKKDENTHLTVSDKLLVEANLRLRKALDSNDFVEAKLAQAMMEGVVKAKEEFKEKRKTVTVLEKQIQKRKDSVITSFFNKKPRNK